MLFLIERVADATDPGILRPLFDAFASAISRAGGELVEIQASRALGRLYVVAEHPDRAALERALRADDLAFDSLAPVRLVGADLADVKAARGDAQYLVEWDFPPELTMETYLARKQEKTPLYAQVPDVAFLRSYVREDMLKCLCLYDGPSEEAIRRAREVVATPISRLSSLEHPQAEPTPLA